VTCTGITATSFTGCTGGKAGTYPTGTTVARATASGSNSVAWSGTLVNVPLNPSWKWQWQLTASARVKNPTGPNAADDVRTSTPRRTRSATSTARPILPTISQRFTLATSACRRPTRARTPALGAQPTRSGA